MPNINVSTQGLCVRSESDKAFLSLWGLSNELRPSESYVCECVTVCEKETHDEYKCFYTSGERMVCEV